MERDYFQKNSIAVRISREMAIDYGFVEPTPEEVEARRLQSERIAADTAARRAVPGPDLTLDSLLTHLGMTPSFATHLLHPACNCYPPYADDDPSLCSWAIELGFRMTGYDDSDDFGRRQVLDP